jgi:hypothetical protein
MKTFLKIILAGIVAVLFLCILCLIYFNLPPQFPSETGASPFRWEKYGYYSRAIEGFGYGKMNNEGYNNLDDYTSQRIDGLLFGSSHMEALQVPQNNTTAANLNGLFNGKKYVYNVSVSDYHLPLIVENLEKAIRYYTPKECIIIETSILEFSTESIKNYINKKHDPVELKTKGLKAFLQSTFLIKMPYIRLFSYQVGTIIKNVLINKIQSSEYTMDGERYAYIINIIMNDLHKISIDENLKIIIFYHPHLLLDIDGSALAEINTTYLEAFKNACNDNGIYFVDMTEPFVRTYNEQHILPHGFSNTAVGAGHLNKNGHQIIASELYNLIESLEGGNR